MAEGYVGTALAREDRFAELPVGVACLAAGSQWFHASGPWIHRPCGEQEGGDRARLFATGRELPAVGDGSLSAQPALCERSRRGQAPGTAMAGDGRGGGA